MPERWTAAAKLRRKQIESGIDITFNDVFLPWFVDLARRIAPQCTLEIGAGTGHLSLALQRAVGQVTAIEPSTGMYEVAKSVLSESGVRILNAAISDLPRTTSFDLAISHLVAHCVSDYPNFLREIARHLAGGGVLALSIPHPCFFNEYKNFFGTEYSYSEHLFKEVSFAITNDKQNLITGVPYHHRPLSYYLNEAIRAGYSLISLEEVFPSPPVQERYGTPWSSPRYCILVLNRT